MFWPCCCLYICHRLRSKEHQSPPSYNQATLDHHPEATTQHNSRVLEPGDEIGPSCFTSTLPGCISNPPSPYEKALAYEHCWSSPNRSSTSDRDRPVANEKVIPESQYQQLEPIGEFVQHPQVPAETYCPSWDLEDHLDGQSSIISLHTSLGNTSTATLPPPYRSTPSSASGSLSASVPHSRRSTVDSARSVSVYSSASHGNASAMTGGSPPPPYQSTTSSSTPSLAVSHRSAVSSNLYLSAPMTPPPEGAVLPGLARIIFQRLHE